MRKKIFVVDDDANARRLVRLILERRGYTIVEAESGFKALAMLEQGMPDLFILDLMMPGMDGFELCRAIRERPAAAFVPIMIYSANPAWRLDRPWHETGANDFLMKTTQPAVLAERVQRLLDDADERKAASSRNAG